MRKLTFLTLFLAGADWAQLRVGVATVKITPPKGAPMAGYYYNRASEGVHDDLHANAIVLEAEGSRAALVSCDIIHLPRPVIEQARRLIEKQTGLRADQVMISATHAHTGPVVVGDSERYNLQDEMGRIARDYAKALPELIAESVQLAARSLKPATARAGAGREATLAFNRRYFMKDGTVGWNPGKKNLNIVRPAGPIDPEVPVVTFEGSDGSALATYVNYAMHLDTVGGLEISADYPYTLYSIIGKVRGGQTMFTIGAAGNINHLDFSDARTQKGHGEAERIGTVLAGEVIKTLTKLEPVNPLKIVSFSETVRLPLAVHEPGDVEWSKGISAKFGAQNAAPFLDMVKAFRVMDVEGRKGKPVEAEVQVIALGKDVAWVALPGEIFVELGMTIKRGSPFQRTIIVELANGSVGYVPDKKAYPEGNYEAVSARCAAGSGEMMVEAALRMLKEAYRWKQ